MAQQDDIPDAKISPDQQAIVDKFLLQAAGDYDRERVNITLQKGANIDTQDSDGLTPIMRAVNSGYYGNVDFILTKKPNLLLRDRWGRTAFDIAAARSDADTRNRMINSLLQALPDFAYKRAGNMGDAIRLAESEAKKPPVELKTPPAAAAKPKGFNP